MVHAKSTLQLVKIYKRDKRSYKGDILSALKRTKEWHEAINEYETERELQQIQWGELLGWKTE